MMGQLPVPVGASPPRVPRPVPTSLQVSFGVLSKRRELRSMAGLMQWFQVTCPNCTAALQVRLPEGVTSVQCSQCKAVFAVQVQPIALSTSSSQPAVKRSRKRKSIDKNNPGSADVNRTLSAYNVFMKGEVAKVKSEHPELPHREAFKLAAERWQSSPMNPQNGGERFPLKHTSHPDPTLPAAAGASTVTPAAQMSATGGTAAPEFDEEAFEEEGEGEGDDDDEEGEEG